MFLKQILSLITKRIINQQKTHVRASGTKYFIKKFREIYVTFRTFQSFPRKLFIFIPFLIFCAILCDNCRKLAKFTHILYFRLFSAMGDFGHTQISTKPTFLLKYLSCINPLVITNKKRNVLITTRSVLHSYI